MPERGLGELRGVRPDQLGAVLGAVVVDGINNHLWSAFKTTVVEWFNSKAFELLGVGGIILELLLEGGLTREHIIQMAMDALIVAIPAALIAVLVEKLVSMWRRCARPSCSWSLPSRSQRRKIGTAVGTIVVGTAIRMSNGLQRPGLDRRAV